MKKYIAFMLTIVLLLCSTGCSSIALQNNNHEFILTPKVCNNLFSCNPNEVRDALEESPWVNGHFVSAKVDGNGNLRLILSDNDINHWKNYIKKQLKQLDVSAAKDGESLKVSDDFYIITTETSKNLAIVAGYDITIAVPLCGIMQMLNGNDPSAWYVDVIVVDVETGRIVKQGRLPDEEFDITEEDWDRIREAVE